MTTISSTPPSDDKVETVASTPSPATINSSASRQSAQTVTSSIHASVDSETVPAMPAVFDMSARDDASDAKTVEYVPSESARSASSDDSRCCSLVPDFNTFFRPFR